MNARDHLLEVAMVVLLIPAAYATITGVTIIAPTNGDTVSNETPVFSFFAITTLNSTFSCDAIIDSAPFAGVRLGTNASVQNNTPATILSNLTLPEDNYLWYAECTDANNTDSSSLSAFVIESTMPVLTIEDENFNPIDYLITGNDTPRIYFMIQDAGGGSNEYLIFIDSVDTGISDSIPAGSHTSAVLSPLTEGNHTVIVQANDDGGNFVNESLWVYYDARPPTVTYLSNYTNDTWLQGWDMTFPVTVNDTIESNFSVFLCLESELDPMAIADTCESMPLDSRFGNGIVTVDLSSFDGIFADSMHANFTFAASDAVGNYNYSTDFTFIHIDREEPEAFINFSNGTRSNNTSQFFTWFAVDELADVLDYDIYVEGLSVANGTIANNTEQEVNITNLTEGAHTFSVEVTDLSGRTASSENYTIIIDLTAPSMASRTPDNNSYVGNLTATGQLGYNLTEDISAGYITFTNTSGNDSDSPQLCVLNGTALLAGDRRIAVNDSVNGCAAPIQPVEGVTYTVTYVMTDLAGNTAVLVSENVTVDGTIPQITSFSAGQVGSTGATLSLATTEFSTCRYSEDDDAYNDMPSTFSTTGINHTTQITGLSPRRRYYYYAVCIDSAGNEGLSANTTFLTTSPSSGGGGGGGGGGAIRPADSQSATRSYSFFNIENDRNYTLPVVQAATVQTITFQTVQDVSGKVSVTVQDEKESSVPLRLDTAYAYFSLTVNGTHTELKHAMLTVKVNRSWLAQHDLQPEDAAVFHLVEEQWITLDTDVSNSSNDSVTLVASTPSFSYFAIAPREKISQAPVIVEQPAPIVVVSEPPAEEITSPPQFSNPAAFQPVGTRTKYSWAIIILLLIAVAAGSIARIHRKPKQPPTLISNEGNQP